MSYGILEYNSEGQVKCEICKDYFDAVCRHTYYSHGMTAKEYKKKFGFNTSKGISSTSFSKVLKVQGYVNYKKHPDQFKNGFRFEKGSKGRPKELLSQQEKIALTKRIAEVSPIISKKGKIITYSNRKIRLELITLYVKLDTLAKFFYKEYYVEDYTQDTMLIALEKPKIVLKDTTLETYLFAIMKNIYLQHFKRLRRRGPLHERIIDLDESAFRLDIDFIKEDDTKKNLGMIWRCIYSLKPRQQELILYRMQGLSNKELQEIYKVEMGSLKNSISHAFKALKEKLITNEILSINNGFKKFVSS